MTTSKLLLVDVALQSLRPVETFIFTVSYCVYSDEDHFVQTILDAPLEFNVNFYKNIYLKTIGDTVMNAPLMEIPR